MLSVLASRLLWPCGIRSMCDAAFPLPTRMCAGCRDYAPYLGVSSALEMWRALGPERCRSYCHTLLCEAAEALACAWGTGTLVPLAMCAQMVLVGLPPGLAASAGGSVATRGDGETDMPATSADAKLVQVSTTCFLSARNDNKTDELHNTDRRSRPLSRGNNFAKSEDCLLPHHSSLPNTQDILHYRYKIECPIKCIQKALYARISVQIYNEMADYERLRDAVLSILGEKPRVSP